MGASDLAHQQQSLVWWIWGSLILKHSQYESERIPSYLAFRYCFSWQPKCLAMERTGTNY